MTRKKKYKIVKHPKSTCLLQSGAVQNGKNWNSKRYYSKNKNYFFSLVRLKDGNKSVIISSMKSAKKGAIPAQVYAGLESGSSFIKNVQKLTIEELIELYAYAEAIVETVREPLVVLDKNLTVKSVNKGFLTTFKVNEKETLGKKIFDLGNGQWNIPQLSKLLLQVLPDKKIVEDFEVSHVFPHIGQKIMQLNARTIILAQYRTQLILLAIEDVTEKKLIDKKTEKFISMASHELRTPITSIMAFMQILEKKLKDGMDKPTSQIMARLMVQLNVLNDIIHDLFDVRKVKEGMLVLHKKNIRVDPVVKEAVTIFGYVHPNRKIEIEGKIGKKLSADKERIIQVLTNLLQNASKYSPETSIIKVKLERKNGEAIISVQDFGDGIPASDQKHIFEAYYSLEKDQTKKGLGLGLYICAEIMKLHKGKIWVDSKLHKGSTFYISLPLR